MFRKIWQQCFSGDNMEFQRTQSVRRSGLKEALCRWRILQQCTTTPSSWWRFCETWELNLFHNEIEHWMFCVCVPMFWRLLIHWLMLISSGQGSKKKLYPRFSADGESCSNGTCVLFVNSVCLQYVPSLYPCLFPCFRAQLTPWMVWAGTMGLYWTTTKMQWNTSNKQLWMGVMMPCLTWEFIISMGKTPTAHGGMRFETQCQNSVSSQVRSTSSYNFCVIHRRLHSSSFWMRLGSVTQLHQWRWLGTFRQEGWKGCLRMRRGLWCKRFSLAWWRKLCYGLLHCSLQLSGISFQWQWLIQGQRLVFAYLKIRVTVTALIVWQREILLTTVPLVSYEFKEAPAAAKEAFI